MQIYITLDNCSYNFYLINKIGCSGWRTVVIYIFNPAGGSHRQRHLSGRQLTTTTTASLLFHCLTHQTLFMVICICLLLHSSNALLAHIGLLYKSYNIVVPYLAVRIYRWVVVQIQLKSMYTTDVSNTYLSYSARILALMIWNRR